MVCKSNLCWSKLEDKTNKTNNNKLKLGHFYYFKIIVNILLKLFATILIWRWMYFIFYPPLQTTVLLNQG